VIITTMKSGRLKRFNMKILEQPSIIFPKWNHTQL